MISSSTMTGAEQVEKAISGDSLGCVSSQRNCAVHFTVIRATPLTFDAVLVVFGGWIVGAIVVVVLRMRLRYDCLFLLRGGGGRLAPAPGPAPSGHPRRVRFEDAVRLLVVELPHPRFRGLDRGLEVADLAVQGGRRGAAGRCHGDRVACVCGWYDFFVV